MKPLIIAYALNVIDYLFTAYWVRLYGIDIEVNPIAKWLFNHNIAWAVKFLAVGGLFALLGYFITRYQKAAWTAYIPLTAYALIVAYHILIAAQIVIITK